MKIFRLETQAFITITDTFITHYTIKSNYETLVTPIGYGTWILKQKVEHNKKQRDIL